MGILCKILGHSYQTSDVASANVCTCCGYVRPAIEWPRLQEPKQTPPAPQVKVPRDPGEPVISGVAIALAQLEGERESIAKMIRTTSREMENLRARMVDLQARHERTTRAMHELIEETCDATS